MRSSLSSWWVWALSKKEHTKVSVWLKSKAQRLCFSNMAMREGNFTTPCVHPHFYIHIFQQCKQPLECGHHLCLKVCHPGNCGRCELSEVRTCPCGKTTYELPCTEDTPTCDDTCGKLLECGQHICNQKCHKDKCGSVSCEKFYFFLTGLNITQLISVCGNCWKIVSLWIAY